MVSIPNYVTKALHKFQHPTPRRAQYAPHQWTQTNYVATKKLSGTFLYYNRSIECKIIPALNKMAEKQSNLTKDTEASITQFPHYASTNTSTII